MMNMEVPKFDELNAATIRLCSMQKRYPDFVKYIQNNYPEGTWSEKLYMYFNNISERPTCVVCGGPVKFINAKVGYRRTCCYKCQGRDPEVIKKKAQTTKSHYGVEQPMHSNVIKKRLVKTNMEKFGVENPFANDTIKEKIKQTNQSRLGVDYPMQSPTVREKSVQTFIERYGVEWNSQDLSVKESVRQTFEDRYGGIGYASKEIRTKCIETARTNGSKCASKISQQFFEELDKHLSQYTTHYDSKNGEMVIDCGDRYYKADYLIEELGIIVEYNGDVWHADPTKFKATDHPNPYNPDLSAQDIWDRDNQRRHDLESLGYRVVVLWDREYKDKKFDISKFLKENIY